MKGLDRDDFFMYQNIVNDPSAGNPPLTSHRSNLIDLPSSDAIATSSVGMNGIVHRQLLLDLTADNRLDAEKDGYGIAGPPNSSSHQAPLPSSLTASGGMDMLEVPEFNPAMALEYISQILMEENVDDKLVSYADHPALLAAQKPFHDILSETSSSSPDQTSSHDSECYNSTTSDAQVNSDRGNNSSVFESSGWSYDTLEYHLLQNDPVSDDYSSKASTPLPNRVEDVNAMLEEALLASSNYVPNATAWQFQKGLEEARKFLPKDDKMINTFNLLQEPKAMSKLVDKHAGNENEDNLIHESRGTKTLHDDDLDLQEGRSTKQRAISSEEVLNSEFYEDALLCAWNKCSMDDKEKPEMPNDTVKSSHRSKAKGSGGGKGHAKKQPKKEVVDFTTLLIHCAQAVAAYDQRGANELLTQIRQYSSPNGDANQRLAHYFAEALRARLAGTGSQIYHSILAQRISAADLLIAYRGYMCVCPFKKVSYFFANMTILNVSENSKKLHIIDFGVHDGFQWPCFLKRLATRPGGPPRLRITGIDLPRPGFRPTERVVDTGRRLAAYARNLGIPFEFHAIAAKWETIQAEDLNIDKDELLVVNSLFHFNVMMEETVVEDSPRNMVLKTIRNLNPCIFIFGVVNGSFNSPFFVTRFREALFHYSALFDMMSENAAPDSEPRLLFERNILGRDALNVIACEGSERVERPETYKQWQVRILRAGFKQIPLNLDFAGMAINMLKAHHKEFVGEVDGKWLLEGWKGRVTAALSTWKSNKSS